MDLNGNIKMKNRIEEIMKEVTTTEVIDDELLYTKKEVIAMCSQYGKELLEKAAREATVIYHCGHYNTNEITDVITIGNNHVMANKESILNITL
jgi:hypothetical protein